MPTVPTFAVRETDVSRHNGDTSGAPLKPLRDDSALRAVSSLRGLRVAPEVPPLCRETLVSRTSNVGTVCKNWLWKRNGGQKWVNKQLCVRVLVVRCSWVGSRIIDYFFSFKTQLNIETLIPKLKKQYNLSINRSIGPTITYIYSPGLCCKVYRY